jgi:hypothetical protein
MQRLLSALKTWCSTAFGLISDIQVYRDKMLAPWQESVKLFLSVTAVLALVQSGVFLYHWWPILNKSITSASDSLIVSYPENQRVIWKNQQLTLDPQPTQPITLFLPAELHSVWKDPFIIYNSNSEADPAKTLTAANQSQPPMFIVNPTQFWSYTTDKTWSGPTPLADFPQLKNAEFTLTKNELIQQQGLVVRSLRKSLQIGLLFVPGLAVLLTWLSVGWFWLLETTIIWGLTKLVGWPTNWHVLGKLTLLCATTAQFAQTIANWLYPELTWSMFNVVFWVIYLWISLFTTKSKTLSV